MDMTSAIRVLLADDHTALRQGLAQMLDALPDICVVAQAGSGEEALAQAEKHRPDVLLLDIHMPGMDGIEAARRIKRACPETRILILTMYRNETLILRAIHAGASGYLLKEAELADLVQGIRAVAQGDAVLDPAITDKVLRVLQEDAAAPPAPHEKLSPHEIEIVRLVALGWSNKEIAAHLCLAEKTIRNRLSRIFRKLGLRNRTEVAYYALKHILGEE